MQEDKQMIVYKRGKEIICKSIALSLIVITSCAVAYKVSRTKIEMANRVKESEKALREYAMKIELQQMTNQYKDFKVGLEKLIAEAETTKKIVTPSTATYIESKPEEKAIPTLTHSTSNVVSESTEAPTEYKAVYEVTATAYCLCQKCCGKSPDNPRYGETSSGLKIVPGTGMKVIAVDPKLIPLGSKVYVEGLNGAKDYGYAIAADQGSAIKNNKIDLYMDTHQQALNWGRKSVKVYVIE